MNDNKVKSFEDLVARVSKNCEYELERGEEKIPIDIQGLTRPEFEEINAYYEDLKTKVSTKAGKVKGGTEVSKIPDQKELKEIEKRNEMALAISYLPEYIRPKVEIEADGLNEQQIKFNTLEKQGQEFFSKIGFGFVMQILEGGMIASGVKIDRNKQIEQAKNS